MERRMRSLREFDERQPISTLKSRPFSSFLPTKAQSPKNWPQILLFPRISPLSLSLVYIASCSSISRLAQIGDLRNPSRSPQYYPPIFPIFQILVAPTLQMFFDSLPYTARQLLFSVSCVFFSHSFTSSPLGTSRLGNSCDFFESPYLLILICPWSHHTRLWSPPIIIDRLITISLDNYCDWLRSSLCHKPPSPIHSPHSSHSR